MIALSCTGSLILVDELSNTEYVNCAKNALIGNDRKHLNCIDHLSREH